VTFLTLFSSPRCIQTRTWWMDNALQVTRPTSHAPTASMDSTCHNMQSNTLNSRTVHMQSNTLNSRTVHMQSNTLNSRTQYTCRATHLTVAHSTDDFLNYFLHRRGDIVILEMKGWKCYNNCDHCCCRNIFFGGIR